MKKKSLLWVLGALAVVLLLGSYGVRYSLSAANAADLMQVIGFICLVVFTVYMFRGDSPQE